MLKQSILSTILTIPLLLAGCSGKKVTVDYDPSAMTQIPGTFSFAPSASGQNDPIAAARFKKGIETALRAKGYRPGPQNQGFKVAYGLQVHEEVPSNFSVGFGIGGGSGPVGVGVGASKQLTHDESDYKIMMVAIDTGTVFWSAGATRRIDRRATPANKESAAASIAAEMIDTFPKAP